jgi:NADPH-dependent glutamate synthase beta subunit-like oxidoreductase
VFEEKSKPGGMMRYGIPAYRLPEDILDQEIDQVLALGIELKTNRALGRDFTLDQLQADGFDALFLSLGLSASRKIDIEGADLNGVLWGIDFLKAAKEEPAPAVEEKVMVIGGGNVAVDVALTALRLGAREVSLACLEKREEMPANPWEIEMALEEGIKIIPSWGPHKILGENGRISGVELVQCTSVFDSQGYFCPLFGETRENLAADQVILAVGQTSDLSFKEGNVFPNREKGLIATNPETLQTNLPGVFSGGDIVKGPGTVIEAIASGRKAASVIDQFLGGDGNIEETFEAAQGPLDYAGKRERGFADELREEVPVLSLEQRFPGFPEVELCFSKGQALKEAARCLQCDLEILLARAREDSQGNGITAS